MIDNERIYFMMCLAMSLFENENSDISRNAETEWWIIILWRKQSGNTQLYFYLLVCYIDAKGVFNFKIYPEIWLLTFAEFNLQMQQNSD